MIRDMSGVEALSGMAPDSGAWRSERSVRVAEKTLDAARQRGEAAMRLLDDAAEFSKQGAKGGTAPDPMGISGREVDVLA